MTNGYHYNGGWPQPPPSSYYLSYQQSGSPPNPNGSGGPGSVGSVGGGNGGYLGDKGDLNRTPRLMGYSVPSTPGGGRTSRGRDGKDLIQCPTPGCDGKLTYCKYPSASIYSNVEN